MDLTQLTDPDLILEPGERWPWVGHWVEGMPKYKTELSMIPFIPSHRDEDHDEYNALGDGSLLREVRRRGLEHWRKGPDFGELNELEQTLRKSDKRPWCYSQWSMQELKSALRGRGIVSSEFEFVVTDVKKEEYVDLLMAADRTDTFPRFFKLPAEIRTMIYIYVCVPDPQITYQCPHQPAICCSSKQLRDETLPIFFGMNRFMLTVRNTYEEDSWDESIKLVLSEGSRVSSTTKKFLLSNRQNIPLLRRLIVNLEIRDRFKKEYMFCLTEVSFSKNLLNVDLKRGDVYNTRDPVGRVGPRFRGTCRMGRLNGQPKGLRSVLKRILERHNGLKAEYVDEILTFFVQAYERWDLEDSRKRQEKFDSGVSSGANPAYWGLPLRDFFSER